MKKNNTLKVLLIAILATFLLTWILPIAYYNNGIMGGFGEFLNLDYRYPAGIFDILGYPLIILTYYFMHPTLFVLAVGAFYGVFEKTGAYRKVVDKIAKIFKGKEIIFFATVIAVLATIVAFCGFSYELIFVLPLLASIILVMGHDRITAATTLIGSIAVGFVGSLFAKPITGVYIESLGTSYTDLLWFRLAILIIGIALLTFNVVWRLKKDKIKKDDEGKELIAEKYELKSRKGKKRAIWPAIVIFDLVLVLMILGAIDFSGAFGVSIFETFNTNVMNFKAWGYPIFANLIGISGMFSGAIGTWTVTDFTMFLVIATIVLAIIYRIKPNDMFEGYKEGAKKFALPALLIFLAYLVLVLSVNHPFVLTLIRPLMEITNGFNALTLSLSSFIASVFYIDANYIASSSSNFLPYVMSIVQDASVYPLVEFIVQAMQGLSILIAPTSIVLLGVISYLKVSYKDWVKNIWKFFLELLLIAIATFIIIIVFKVV